MRIRREPSDPREPQPAVGAWLPWLQQLTSLVYLVAGIFLLYQYWSRMRRPSVLVVGALFVVYSIYRFFLVRRAIRGPGRGR